MVNVAILGFGTVGSGVAEVLTTNGGLIDHRVDDLVRLKYILDVRDFPDSKELLEYADWEASRTKAHASAFISTRWSATGSRPTARRCT